MEENNNDNKNQNEKRLKNRNFIDAWSNAFNGIIYAVTTQSNIKKQLVIAVIVMLVSLLFNLSRAEFLCLMFTVILIIVAEMINTAIETVVDLYTDKYHPKAKIAKDVAAGSVLLMAINSVIVAYFIFLKDETIGEISKNKTGILTKKFIPSGQTALAFAVLTSIWINTQNILIFTLALMLSLMVFENRIESKMHSLAESIFGSFMGILIVLLVYGLTLL